jgi:hypothetical protein
MKDLTYNSAREDVVIPEYGRNIHQMVQHLKSIADRDERTKCATAVVSIMGSVVTQEGGAEEISTKLWGQLFAMAEFELDVDAPHEPPTRENREEPPARIAYPDEKSRLGHYGKTTRELILKAKTYEAGEERDALVLTVANLMKRHFLTWNRGTVEDAFIWDQLKEQSEGELLQPEGAELVSSAEILKSKRKTSDAMDRWHGKKKKSR